LCVQNNVILCLEGLNKCNRRSDKEKPWPPPHTHI
jgi:hypothetical protein